jgi:hypothetical protein
LKFEVKVEWIASLPLKHREREGEKQGLLTREE